MDRLRTPLRRRSVALVAALVAVASLGACGTGPIGRSPAAVVNGHEIDGDAVVDLLEAQERYLTSQIDDPETGEDRAVQLGEALAGFSGDGPDTFATSEATSALNSWINYTIVLDHLEEKGESVTDADREAARTDLVSQLQSEEAVDAVDPELLKFSINSAAAYKALERIVGAQPAPDDEERKRELYEEVKAERPLCLNLIVSETDADADAALARVEGGEDFGAVASEVSADPSTAAADGFAGCATPEQASASFGGDYSTAAAGDVFGPLELNGLFVLVEVDSTTGPTFEQIEPELESQIATEGGDINTRLQEYLVELVGAADITVDPRFGTWDAETGSLLPPTV